MKHRNRYRNSLLMRAMMEAGIRNLTKNKIPNNGNLISLYDWWDMESYDKFQVDIIHDTRIHDKPYIMVYHFPNSTGAAGWSSATYYYGPVFVNKKGKVIKKDKE